MRKKQDYLIYDAYCDFCYKVAEVLHKHLNVHTVPSYMVRLKAEGLERETIKHDVHFVVFTKNVPKVYHGAEAAIRVLAIKYRFLIALYAIPGIRQLIKGLYYLVKKSRKFLSKFV